ncbi:DUF2147 domain-containing protein [Hymenobacter sp. HD11105]
MKHFLFCLLLWLATLGAASAQTHSPLGVWVDDMGETRVEIYRCGESKKEKTVCGRLAWLSEPQDSTTGLPKTDRRNPDPSKRNVPLQNLVVMQNLTYDPADDRWTGGKIYDPLNGRTYSCYLYMVDKDRMEVKGYIGFSFIGRSHYWSRVRGVEK